jgi:predicted Rossmann-fold nucleotide-binding protein
MPRFPFKFNPFPEKLYSPDELLKGFNKSPLSYGTTVDFQIYREFVSSGGFAPTDYLMAMMQSLHDNAMRELTQGFLKSSKAKAVAVMGGHDLGRSHPVYRKVAHLARELARDGFTPVSGGGPGAMEATHLGALLKNASDQALKDALRELGRHPHLPADIGKIVNKRGKPNVSLVKKTHAWLLPAYRIWERFKHEKPGLSLAIPTWLYGHEPTTPLAPKIAKYFQNSIREDRLLAIATHGVIYVKGRAGTVQEIFQDATQNYYRTLGSFSPMILFGVKDYWSKTIPVVPVLKALFKAADYSKYVLVTDEPAKIIPFLISQEPRQTPSQRMSVR